VAGINETAKHNKPMFQLKRKVGCSQSVSSYSNFMKQKRSDLPLSATASLALESKMKFKSSYFSQQKRSLFPATFPGKLFVVLK
jgi:hypothetical protein